MYGRRPGEILCPLSYMLFINYEIYLREADFCIWFNLLSDSVAFTNSVHPELEKDMREVNVLIWFSNDQI